MIANVKKDAAIQFVVTLLSDLTEVRSNVYVCGCVSLVEAQFHLLTLVCVCILSTSTVVPYTWHTLISKTARKYALFTQTAPQNRNAFLVARVHDRRAES